jgi:Transmembrane domain of unknown function (DUF3566)
LNRRTSTSDGSAGASPTVVTAPYDDDDLTTEDDQPTQILGTRSARTATSSATAKEAPAKEAPANGTSAADAEADVPELPADSIGSTRDSFAAGPSAPASPDAAADRTPSDNGTSPPATEPEAEPAPAETGTGWPAGSTPSGAGAATESPARDSSPAGSSQSPPPGRPEPGAVSAAAFAWDPPEPASPSASSQAGNFLRSNANAQAPAPPRTPPVSVGPADGHVGPGALGAAPARDARAKRSARRSARQAHLTIARVEPWSVMKFSFVVSLVSFVILFVAVSVIYGTLSALGVFNSLQHVVQSVTSSQDSNGVNASKWFTASRVLSYTALLGALNIVLITAMCTIGAVIYNLTSRLIGGVEVTLRETE